MMQRSDKKQDCDLMARVMAYRINGKPLAEATVADLEQELKDSKAELPGHLAALLEMSFHPESIGAPLQDTPERMVEGQEFVIHCREHGFTPKETRAILRVLGYPYPTREKLMGQRTPSKS